MAHDVARAMPDDELLRQAEEFGLPIGPVDRSVPLLLHGPVGAELLRVTDGLDDPSVYQAVYWHTSGHAELDLLGQVVFLADKLDPQKIERYPYLPYIRKCAEADLEGAMREFLGWEVASLTSRGIEVHPAMAEARDGLLARRRLSGGPAGGGGL
jgi:predicted HD superfamily hydrolase involved in NAD metabolism